MSPAFWAGRTVFVTGHSGFKGTWLSALLTVFGAKVSGFSLPPVIEGCVFNAIALPEIIHKSEFGDIRDINSLERVFHGASPSVIFHLAAQPLVRASHHDPLGTFAVNLLGTTNLLEVIRLSGQALTVVIITTDKCYENREWIWPYRETDRLGGHDPYSSSKSCAELAVRSYRECFFRKQGTRAATARAGNVIGGGDWADQRLIPDFYRAYFKRESLKVRFPSATRPWQHVLEPLSGYLTLAEHLTSEGSDHAYDSAWNFGPIEHTAWSVSQVLSYLRDRSPGSSWSYEGAEIEESSLLALDCSKAASLLKWSPRWTIEAALQMTADWYEGQYKGQSMRKLTFAQIDEYLTAS